VLAQLDPVARTMLRGVCRDFRRGVDASGLKRAGGGRPGVWGLGDMLRGEVPLRVKDFVGSVARLAWAKANGCRWDWRVVHLHYGLYGALGSKRNYDHTHDGIDFEVVQFAVTHRCCDCEEPLVGDESLAYQVASKKYYKDSAEKILQQHQLLSNYLHYRYERTDDKSDKLRITEIFHDFKHWHARAMSFSVTSKRKTPATMQLMRWYVERVYGPMKHSGWDYIDFIR